MARRIPKTDAQRVEFVPNFRPFISPIDIPELGVCENPSYSMCINADWMPIIRGLLHTLDQPDVWNTEDPDEIFAARQEVRELTSMGQCLCGYPASSEALNVTINATHNAQLIEIFLVSGLDGVAPDRPDTSFDADTGDDDEEQFRRKVALCWAVTDYVTTVVEKGIFNAFIPDAVTMLTAGGISFLVSPIGGLVYLFASSVAEALINTVARSPEVIADVACCMLEGLQGLAITEANFAASLDNCGFGVLSDAAFVKDAVKTGIDDTGNYLAFVAMLGSFMGATPASGSCACEPPACTSDFQIDEGGWTRRNAQAEYVDGVGWDNSPSGAFNHIINIEFIHTVDWNVEFVRVTITNNEEVDNISLVCKIRDEFDTNLQNRTVSFKPGETTKIVKFNVATDFRNLNIRAETTAFPDDNIKAIIKKVEALTGDCVFPAQPV